MRFKRPTTKVAAIRCPSCRHIFEVESATLQEEPILAQVVEEEPVAVVVVEQVVVPARAIAVEAVEPQETIAAPLRPVLPLKHKTAKKAPKPANPAKRKQAILLGSIAGGLLVCVFAAFSVTKYLNSRAKPTALTQLATRFEENLEGVRQTMLAHQSNPNQQEVNLQVLQLRDLLVDSVNSPTSPESEFGAVSAKLNGLSELQVEVRRLSNQIAPGFDRKSMVDQLPSMIELINKQLNYGLRQPRSGREPVDQFCQQTFATFREVDQSLGKAMVSGELDVLSIGQRIEDLDQQIVNYSKSAESRSELGFENKQILECGTAWRAWCLRQMQVSGRSAESQAITRELDEIASRFNLALRASAVESYSLAAVDRINRRINGESIPASKPSTLGEKPAPPTSSIANNQVSGSSSSSSTVSSPYNPQPATSAPATNDLASNQRNPFEVQQPNSTPQSIPANANVSNRDGVMESSVPQPSLGSNNSENKSISTINAPLLFPAARYQGPGTLTIKVTSKKSQAELQQIGAQIAARIGAVFDLQMGSNLATLSFSTYSGKVHNAIQHVTFGKVEISDLQSQTLFVNDSE